MVCVSFCVICIVERLVSSVICRFQGLSYSHVPECIEFSFILFVHHNIHFYFELCTYCNILDIYLSWNMNSVKYLFIWNYWIIYFVACILECYELTHVLPLTRPHQRQSCMSGQALLHHWLCNQKHPWGICTLRWRHNDHAGVSNHRPHGCLLNRLYRRTSKKTSKLRVTGLCAGNSPGTGEFPAQMASYAENVSIWWRHHEL